MIGNKIQNYKIISLLGEGGMGDVYLGEHVSIKRKVAIKVLKPELVKNEEIRKRFKNEASMLAHLQHPNIVGLIDYIEQEDGLYLIMEYVDGRELDEVIKNLSAPISIDRAKKLMKQILEAFSYAHQNGIVHRDVKPSNIIITADDQIKVLDFGIAKLVGDTQHQLTKTGTQVGTVYYMSPEQVKGKELDLRSDIYSLGVTFYELLSGVCPYRGMTTEYEIYDSIVKVPLLPLTQTLGNEYAQIWGVIEKSIQKEANNRYQNCDEFRLAFELPVQPILKVIPQESKAISIVKKEEPKSSKGKWVLGLSLLVLIGIFAFWKFSSFNEDSKDNTITFIDEGLVSEGDGYSIQYSYYNTSGGELLPYQKMVNDEIKEFLIESSFIQDKTSFHQDSLGIPFFSRLLTASAQFANEECGQERVGSQIEDVIKIDTTFIDFVQVKMEMYGYQCGGTGWSKISNKIVEKNTAQVLGIQHFVSNTDIFTKFAESCFRKQKGLNHSDGFGDRFTFPNDKFYCPKNFYLLNKNFVFIFEKYDIACGAEGPVNFSVPFSEIDHLLTRSLKTSSPTYYEAPIEEKIQVEQMELSKVHYMMENYYNDVTNETFEASNYFAEEVKVFISRKNCTPIDINEINKGNDEFSDRHVMIIDESMLFNHFEEEIQYWEYWIDFTCYRSSKSKYQLCKVKIEIGIDPNGKLVSYRETQVTDLQFVDYDPNQGD